VPAARAVPVLTRSPFERARAADGLSGTGSGSAQGFGLGAGSGFRGGLRLGCRFGLAGFRCWPLLLARAPDCAAATISFICAAEMPELLCISHRLRLARGKDIT